MEWIGAKVNWIKKIKFFAHPYLNLINSLLEHDRTRGTPSLGPSMPGMKSIRGPIQLKGLQL